MLLPFIESATALSDHYINGKKSQEFSIFCWLAEIDSSKPLADPEI